jgi:hypothetical protein
MTACTKDPNLWFSVDPKKQSKAVSICQTCPFKDACLQMAVDTKEIYGTWGGTTEQELKQAFSPHPYTPLNCIRCKNTEPATFAQTGTHEVNGGTRWINPLIECGKCGFAWDIPQARWNRQKVEAA